MHAKLNSLIQFVHIGGWAVDLHRNVSVLERIS